MSQSPEMKATMNMTANTLGKDLLSALVLELKMMPDTWVRLSEKKQNDIIDRLRNRVDASVKMAVHLIAANGRTVVQGDLDKITIKDGAQALTVLPGQGLAAEAAAAGKRLQPRTGGWVVGASGTRAGPF